jgi:hypothetical protein
LTYVKDHEIFAWHQHVFSNGDDDAVVESVCVIPEGSGADRFDMPYLLIKRTIDGDQVRYVECMQRGFYTDSWRYRHLDSHKNFNGWSNIGTSGWLKITEYLAGGWAVDAIVTATTESDTFNELYVDDEIHFGTAGNVDLKLRITAKVSNKVVRAKVLNMTVPVARRDPVENEDWGIAYRYVTGLWHLEGESISAYGDGWVVASPNNSDYSEVVVEDGIADLGAAYAYGFVGLPMIADVGTLDIDTDASQSLVDKGKLVTKVELYFENTRGLFVGCKEPDGTDPLENLTEMKLREDEDYDESTDVLTGHANVIIQPEWTQGGRIFIRQVDPLPATIVGIFPSFAVSVRQRGRR